MQISFVAVTGDTIAGIKDAKDGEEVVVSLDANLADPKDPEDKDAVWIFVRNGEITGVLGDAFALPILVNVDELLAGLVAVGLLTKNATGWGPRLPPKVTRLPGCDFGVGDVVAVDDTDREGTVESVDDPRGVFVNFGEHNGRGIFAPARLTKKGGAA